MANAGRGMLSKTAETKPSVKAEYQEASGNLSTGIFRTGVSHDGLYIIQQ